MSKFTEHTVGSLIQALAKHDLNTPVRGAIWNDLDYQLKLNVNVQREEKDFACVTIGICADDPDWANTWDGVSEPGHD